MSHLKYFCPIIEKKRMLADFYIPRLSYDMKTAVQKNHLGGQILYRNPDRVKKNCKISEFQQI